MRYLIFFLFSFYHFWLPPSFGQSEAPQSLLGSYVGILSHKMIERDQLAKLHFIPSREVDNKLELKAILTLQFGDFQSQEYISYHFEKVHFDLLTGVLVFDQEDQELTLKTVSFSNGKLTAQLRSQTAGWIGNLDMELNGESKPQRALVEPVGGEFKGICEEGKITTLQLVSYRSTDDTHRTGDPYGAYEIKGQWGQMVENLCPNQEGLPCVTNIIHSGTYNFFQGEMTLFGKQKNLSCQWPEKGIQCGNCLLKRQSGEMRGPLQKRPSQPENIFMKNRTENGEDGPGGNIQPSQIQGEFEGYLHHEYLNLYQPAHLNLMTFLDIPERGSQRNIKISAVAKLFFGGEETSEVLSYRFNTRSFPLMSSQIVLERMEDDVDPILQITQFKDDVLMGTWYSMLFGRVGTFVLWKRGEGTRENLRPAQTFQSLSGHYESQHLKMEFSARLGRTPVNTENPFYPLVLGGHIYYKQGFLPKIPITGGSFDFYTGRMAILAEDGERVIVGNRKPNEKDFKFRWAHKKFGAIWPVHEWEKFSFREPPSGGH